MPSAKKTNRLEQLKHFSLDRFHSYGHSKSCPCNPLSKARLKKGSHGLNTSIAEHTFSWEFSTKCGPFVWRHPALEPVQDPKSNRPSKPQRQGKAEGNEEHEVPEGHEIDEVHEEDEGHEDDEGHETNESHEVRDALLVDKFCYMCSLQF
jgi:hypothetical protein